MGGQRLILSLAQPRWRRPRTCKIDQFHGSASKYDCLVAVGWKSFNSDPKFFKQTIIKYHLLLICAYNVVLFEIKQSIFWNSSGIF